MLVVLENCVCNTQKLQFQLGQHFSPAAATLGALVRIVEFPILNKNLSQILVFQSSTLLNDFLKSSTSTF